MRVVLLAFVLITLTAGTGAAERVWVNSIAVGEYDITWSYTETFSGADSAAYRMSIDEEFGDNDSFITSWELRKLDGEMRKRLRSSINSEFDVRIETPYLNTGNNGIEVIDVDASLSAGIIGKTNLSDTIVNRYRVSYRFKNSIFNASSIWFLGQARSPVTITLLPGLDVTEVRGMDNVTKRMDAHTEISGFFTEISPNVSRDRGEIILGLSKNTSVKVSPEIYILNVTVPENTPVDGILSKIKDASLLGLGILLILWIYVFKIRKK